MKIFAISDLHLSFSVDKPMDIFGNGWQNHFELIKADWEERVSGEDIVLIAGDTSWGMSLNEALPDIFEISKLKGHKYIIRGNHDYWWTSYSKITSLMPPKMNFIQNNALKNGGYIICGTRGWTIPDGTPPADELKYLEREKIRLELSLKQAASLRTDGEKIIALIHYPPFNVKYDDSDFTSLLSSYGVSAVVYGHLHGKNVRAKMLVDKGGIPYYLTSCDLLENKLLEISVSDTI